MGKVIFRVRERLGIVILTSWEKHFIRVYENLAQYPRILYPFLWKKIEHGSPVLIFYNSKQFSMSPVKLLT